MMTDIFTAEIVIPLVLLFLSVYLGIRILLKLYDIEDLIKEKKE